MSAALFARARHCAWVPLMALMALALMLSGCAGLLASPPAPPNGIPLVFHPAIELAGRLSVRYQQNGKEESLQGGFRWLQDPQRIMVDLLSPLNQTMATLVVTPQAATLNEAGKPPRSAPDIDSLTGETFGWSLPVAGLRGWLQGFELEHGKARPIAEPGVSDAPPVTTPDGWQLRYVSWQSEAQDSALRPRRIDLQRSSAQLGDVSIRIVIDSWQTPINQ